MLGRVFRLACLGALLLLPTAASQAEEIRFAVGVDPAYSPFFLADGEKLFARGGLDVRVVQYSQGTEALDSVLAGQNQFAGTTEASALNRSTRGDIKALAVFSQSGTFIKLVVRNGIKEVSDIKRLGIVAGSVNDFASSKLLAKFGIDPHAVQSVNAGPPEMPALLARGDIDGYVLWEPWPTNGVKAGGHVLLMSQDFGYTYNLLVVVSGKWFDTHKPEAARVVSAVAQACDEIRQDPNKAGAATQAAIKIPAAQVVGLLEGVDCRVRDFTDEDVANYVALADFLAARGITKTKADAPALLVRGFVSSLPK